MGPRFAGTGWGASVFQANRGPTRILSLFGCVWPGWASLAALSRNLHITAGEAPTRVGGGCDARKRGFGRDIACGSCSFAGFPPRTRLGGLRPPKTPSRIRLGFNRLVWLAKIPEWREGMLGNRELRRVPLGKHGANLGVNKPHPRPFPFQGDRGYR